MKRLFSALLLFLLSLSFPVAAWDRGEVTRFATLPAGATPPEGIAVDIHGNVYVSTFGFPASGPPTDPGQIIVFDRHGKLLHQAVVAGASPHLLGLDFHPLTRELLVIDFGAGKVLKVNPLTGAASVFSDIGPASGLNALTFDSLGNVYISDSFQGIIWRTSAAGGPATAWADQPAARHDGRAAFRGKWNGIQQQRQRAVRSQYGERLRGKNPRDRRGGGDSRGVCQQHQRRRWPHHRRRRQPLDCRQSVR